ncbi:hypothetical protein LR48_Vigan01g187400 [Vigna angularis]|uniref:Uncharacterized protein n=1 Tax=Phaseolus angularis TaxID=3914 RepID=A0A0L9TP11_PHAAN|nr:hypothetical protein LR48_Vigan01g187400 [Vigna angularis]
MWRRFSSGSWFYHDDALHTGFCGFSFLHVEEANEGSVRGFLEKMRFSWSAIWVLSVINYEVDGFELMDVRRVKDVARGGDWNKHGGVVVVQWR